MEFGRYIRTSPIPLAAESTADARRIIVLGGHRVIIGVLLSNVTEIQAQRKKIFYSSFS